MAANVIEILKQALPKIPHDVIAVVVTMPPMCRPRNSLVFAAHDICIEVLLQQFPDKADRDSFGIRRDCGI